MFREKNPDIFRTRSIFRILVYLETEAYSGHCQTSAMERFAKTVLGQFPPRQLPPRQLPPGQLPPPGTIPTQYNSSPDNCSPDYSRLEQLPFEQFPRTIPTQDYFITPPDIYTRTITIQNNDNYKLHFFRDCFLFLFHGPII